MNTSFFRSLGKITPWTLWILNYKGKTFEAGTSSTATGMSEVENSKDLNWASKDSK